MIMGKLFPHINPEIKDWLYAQKMFFVATAPLSSAGHINCSPKGLDSFRVLDPNTVAYQDLTGSGAETIAHINENGRIVLMFCAFEGPPKIYRLYGKAEVVLQSDKRYLNIHSQFPENAGTRAYIVIHLSRITDSCGWGVPLYEFVKNRDSIEKWNQSKGTAGIIEYRREKNRLSIDNLPALE